MCKYCEQNKSHEEQCSEYQDRYKYAYTDSNSHSHCEVEHYSNSKHHNHSKHHSHSKKHYQKCDCNGSKHRDECLDRDYLCDSTELRIKLAKINDDLPDKSKKNVKVTPEEAKYRHVNYSGSFHKLFQHKPNTGELQDPSNYRKYVRSILANDQYTFNQVKLSVDAEGKLVDPLGSLSGVLYGADACSLKLPAPPSLSSKAGSAEMIEVYGMKLSRDVWFGNFNNNSTINEVIGYMQPASKYLPDLLPHNTINENNLFRGNAVGELVGPYVSQLLLLNINHGAFNSLQQYDFPVDAVTAKTDGYTVEWGRNNHENIMIQNGNKSGLPDGPTLDQLVKKYINTGRSLAELVHSDPPFHICYNGALILQSLGVKSNQGIPVLPSQGNFLTNGGGASMLCALGEVTDVALKHAWYWKWQVYRKVRPEVFGLWVDNVKNSRVDNECNYEINSLLLDSDIMEDVKESNEFWNTSGTEFSNSYTLAQCYQEGGPAHPAYPAGHAVIAGACATVIKIYLDCEQKWSEVSGIAKSVTTSNPKVVPTSVTNGVAQASSDGLNLENYMGSDQSQLYVYGEVNKMASNIANGRNWAGVHYRTDGTRGLKLGEDVAIRYMEDKMSTWVANNVDGTVPELVFRKFDNTLYTIKPNICK